MQSRAEGKFSQQQNTWKERITGTNWERVNEQRLVFISFAGSFASKALAL